MENGAVSPRESGTIWSIVGISAVVIVILALCWLVVMMFGFDVGSVFS